MGIREIIRALQETTQALKDIINASQNGCPYTPSELIEFTGVYAEGVRVIVACGHEEIA